MSVLKVKGWVNPHDVSVIQGLVTLTRFIDPANNSDKYRRIITLEASGERPMLLTHTGRWTRLTARGDWSGGTYRYQGVVSRAAHQRNPRIEDLHDRLVQQKKADYTVQAGFVRDVMSTRDISYALHKADAVETTVHTVTPVTPAATATPAPPRMTGGDLGIRISNLIARASTDGVDPFDLFEDLALLNAEVKAEYERVEQMQLDLKLANETIMQRI